MKSALSATPLGMTYSLIFLLIMTVVYSDVSKCTICAERVGAPTPKKIIASPPTSYGFFLSLFLVFVLLLFILDR